MIFWDGEALLPGMQLDAPHVLQKHKIVDRSCEYVILHPTFYSKPVMERMTTTSIFACVKGSVVLTVWPASTLNVTKLGLAWREEEIESAPSIQGLLAPHMLLLQVGDMVTQRNKACIANTFDICATLGYLIK